MSNTESTIAQPEPVVDIRGLCKTFKHVTALSGVNLQVHRDEVVALLGPNGAGKSTLTRILATTVLPDSGTAKVCGFEVTDEPLEVRRRLGVTLSDERSWYWRLSGRQNLEFFAALYGLEKEQRRSRVSDVLHLVGLAEASDRRFDGYSSGMRARLSLARALLPDPPVLLLDEPTRSMDPAATYSFRETVLSLVRDHQKSVLLTTHNLQEAAAMANRVSVLIGGRIRREIIEDVTAGDLEALFLDLVPA